MPTIAPAPSPIRIRPSTPADRETIYALRHDVYALELGQHAINPLRRLTDALDEHNTYLIAEARGRLIGFVSITPPTAPRYSVEKYLARHQIPVAFDDRLYEVRILTVARGHRRGPAAVMLMRAALQAVREAGGETILAMGRREVAGLYRRLGLRPLGVCFASGAVAYELMGATVDEIDHRCREHPAVLERVGRALESPPADAPPGAAPACDHGGAFFTAIGDTFDDLSRRHAVINADVLDAWFPPAPCVAAALREHLDWLLATSPPTHAEGLVRVIGQVRGIPPESIVVGPGSSSLIFLALRRWLTPSSRALVLCPMYAEYEHVLARIVGCRVDRLPLDPADDFRVDPAALRGALARGYDLVALVNPNNPTGQHLARAVLEPILRDVPAHTRIWIDEAYADYAGRGQSLEPVAAASDNIVVCKSLSKAYALSGARAAYLVAPPAIAADLRAITPPWAVSLPAQVAAVHALRAGAYYARRYAETHALRASLAERLGRFAPWRTITGVMNSVLCLLPESMPAAGEIVAACRARGLYLRDCASISPSIGPRALRISVKDAATNGAILDILGQALRAG